MQSGEAWGRQQLHTSRVSRFVEKVFSEKIHLLQLQPKYIGLTNLRSCRSASPNAVWNIYHMRYMVHWVILRYILCEVYAQVTTCAIDKISQSLHWPIVNYEHLWTLATVNWEHCSNIANHWHLSVTANLLRFRRLLYFLGRIGWVEGSSVFIRVFSKPLLMWTDLEER